MKYLRKPNYLESVKHNSHEWSWNADNVRIYFKIRESRIYYTEVCCNYPPISSNPLLTINAFFKQLNADRDLICSDGNKIYLYSNIEDLVTCIVLNFNKKYSTSYGPYSQGNSLDLDLECSIGGIYYATCPDNNLHPATKADKTWLIMNSKNENISKFVKILLKDLSDGS